MKTNNNNNKISNATQQTTTTTASSNRIGNKDDDLEVDMLPRGERVTGRRFAVLYGTKSQQITPAKVKKNIYMEK